VIDDAFLEESEEYTGVADLFEDELMLF